MKRGRLRMIGRWGVWVVTALVLISIPVSVWAESGVGLQVATDGRPYFPRRVQAGVSGYHAWVQYNSSYSLHGNFSSGDPLASGFRVGWMSNGPFPPVTSGWWELSSFSYAGGRSGPMKRLDIPLVYPAVLMVGWSLWLVRGVRRRRFVAGCCVGCGYCLVGLSGGVCPECGEKSED